MCVYSLKYPTSNANAPNYSVICGVSGYLLTSTSVRGNMLLNKMCYEFLYGVCLKHLNLGVIQPDIITNVHTIVFVRKVPDILVAF
jgi:hypothetical protein